MRFFWYLGIPLLVMGGVILSIRVGTSVSHRPVVIDQPNTLTTIDGQVPIGGPFDLKDVHGKRWTDQDFLGKFRLVYFGYTYCPDICPMALTTLSEVLTHLGRDRDQVKVIFITVDPERDTAEVLRTYTQHFHPDITMLTGTVRAIEQAKSSYKVYAAKAEDPKATDYLMDHSTFIYLMDRQGAYLTHYPHTVSLKDLKESLVRVFVEERRQKIR